MKSGGEVFCYAGGSDTPVVGLSADRIYVGDCLSASQNNTVQVSSREGCSFYRYLKDLPAIIRGPDEGWPNLAII